MAYFRAFKAQAKQQWINKIKTAQDCSMDGWPLYCPLMAKSHTLTGSELNRKTGENFQSRAKGIRKL